MLIGVVLSECGIKYGSIESVESATCQYRGRRAAMHRYCSDCHDGCALHKAGEYDGCTYYLISVAFQDIGSSYVVQWWSEGQIRFQKVKMVEVHGRLLSEYDGAMNMDQLVMRHILASSGVVICMCFVP